MAEKDIIYVEKKKMQYSKVVTSLILLIITVTWIIGLFVYKDSVEYFESILNYVQACSLGVMPYFCLSAVDRIQYMVQAKYKSKGE